MANPWDFDSWWKDIAGAYEAADTAVGGWLPGGAPTQGEVPVVSGLERAWAQAWNPTEGHLSAPLRDIPVIGGLTRGVGELPMNVLQQWWERVPEPFFGGLIQEDPRFKALPAWKARHPDESFLWWPGGDEQYQRQIEQQGGVMGNVPAQLQAAW